MGTDRTEASSIDLDQCPLPSVRRTGAAPSPNSIPCLLCSVFKVQTRWYRSGESGRQVTNVQAGYLLPAQPSQTKSLQGALSVGLWWNECALCDQECMAIPDSGSSAEMLEPRVTYLDGVQPMSVKRRQTML